MKKLKILILTLIMVISMIIFANYSYADENEVTLDISQGNIKITPTGYSIGGGEEIEFNGKYIITGTRTDVDILEIYNETGSEFSVDITLDNVKMYASSIWGTMFGIKGNSPVNIDLTIVGDCTIQSLGWAPIYSQNTAKVKIIIDDSNGSLTLQNTSGIYAENRILGEDIYVENIDGYVYNSKGEKIETEHDYEATYNWSEDGKQCILNLICKKDNTHTISDVDMNIEEEIVKEPTCIEEGITKYTATATVDGVEYQDSIEKTDIEATGEHNYIDGVCSVCGEQNTLSNEEGENSVDNSNEQENIEEEVQEDTNNPKTSDTSYVYVSMLIVSIIGLTIIFKIKKQ